MSVGVCTGAVDNIYREPCKARDRRTHTHTALTTAELHLSRAFLYSSHAQRSEAPTAVQVTHTYKNYHEVMI